MVASMPGSIVFASAPAGHAQPGPHNGAQNGPVV